MRIGLFCFYSSNEPDGQGAIPAQTALVRHAESLGFDDAWVAEHHFDPKAVSPSILVLLGHLAGITTRLRLGSAAVLLPFRNPIQVAEDIATIDILSGGRFNFGVAKGGPFPGQNEHFGVSRSDSRGRTMEALTLIGRLLTENHVHFSGLHYHAEDVTISPRPVQAPIPTWLATMTEDGIRFAAARGIGIMGTLLASSEKLHAICDIYTQAAPGKNPSLAVARLFHTAPSHAQAVAEAGPFIRDFAQRMHANTAALAPEEPNHFSEQALMARSLIGGYEEVAEQIAALREAAPVDSLMLKPAVHDAARAAASLAAFADHVRPRLGS
jgi:alkanesulfonate monooxygenase SsuD/methylene tetrahydromethanopterin reductase-like flavin-dependent oxidoreductase (luciferase family)